MANGRHPGTWRIPYDVTNWSHDSMGIPFLQEGTGLVPTVNFINFWG